MTTYTNRANLPLSIAVWLTHDTYDHDSRSNHISATSLLRPARQTVLVCLAGRNNEVAEMWLERLS